MTVVCASIDIAVPPQQVFDLIMDPDRFGDWVTIHRRLEHRDEGPVGEGFTVRQTLALAGAPFKVTWLCTRFEPPHLGEWRGDGPARSRAVTVNELSEREGGTHFSYTNEFKAPGGPLGAMAGRVLVGGLSEREARASLAQLKALLER